MMLLYLLHHHPGSITRTGCPGLWFLLCTLGWSRGHLHSKGWCERMTWGHSQLMREACPTNKGYRFTPAMCSIPHLARIYEHESSREKDFTQIVERHAKVENIWCAVLRSYCTNTRAGFSLWACTSNCLMKA